jgi:hypothetical protein
MVFEPLRKITDKTKIDRLNTKNDIAGLRQLSASFSRMADRTEREMREVDGSFGSDDEKRPPTH